MSGEAPESREAQPLSEPTAASPRSRFMVHPTAAAFLGGMIALAWGTTAMAPIIVGGWDLSLVFARPGVVKQASWTQSANLKLGPHGLILEAPGSQSIKFQLQTTEPLAIGLSRRPARSASIRATLEPRTSSITLGNGQTYTPGPGRMFARYSPDTKHWSPWQPLATTSTEPMDYTFSGQLIAFDHEYNELCRKYADLPSGKRGNEEACVQWILRSQPDFFAKHLPFVGYIQFLYETDLAGGQRIEHLLFEVSPYDVSGLGLHSAEDWQTPWRFRAQ
jgi:hypothetical protein